MGEWLQGFIEQFKQLWNRLNKRARIIILISVILVSSFLVFLIVWGDSPGYKPLFTQLTTRDADAIIKKLEEMGIEYNLADGGTTVLVPESKVYKTRLNLAGEGLPTQGVVGFEIFNNSQFGTTDFEREVNFYRALGGELSRSIRAMNSIEFAKVQISAPEDSLFIDKEKPAKASVLLKIRPGYRLSNSQVRAIGNLVASSVQELNYENVTIVDTAGNLLTPETGADLYDNGLSVDQFSIQRKFEEGLKSDLTAMLTKVLGPDNFTVQVNARLNFDRHEVESTTYSPVVGDEGIIRSQEESGEDYQGSGGVSGLPGTSGNIPQYQAQNTDSGTNTYQKQNTVTNYEINEKIERHQYSPGQVERLSVAVLINGDVEQDIVDTIKESVETAIGYSQQRGDRVTVASLAFDQGLENEIARAQAEVNASNQRRTYIYGGLIILLVIILFVTLLILRRSGEPQQAPAGGNVDYRVGEEEELPEEEFKNGLTEEEKRRQKMKTELESLVTERPKEVAQLLKGWLLEE